MTCAILCFTPTTSTSVFPPSLQTSFQSFPRPLSLSSPPQGPYPLPILVSSSSKYPVVASSVHAPRGACEWYSTHPILTDDLLQNILSVCFSLLAGNPILLSEQPAKPPRLHSSSFRPPPLIIAIYFSFVFPPRLIEIELENHCSDITAGPSPSFAPPLCPAPALWLRIS